MPSVRAALFPAALAAALTAWGGGGQAAQCPRPPDLRVAVDVRTSQAKTDYRYDQSTAEITRLHAKDRSAESRRHGGKILGLTRVNYGYAMSAEYATMQMADGAVCLWVTAVNATLDIKSLVVYVSSDYRQGGCEFAAILQHENSHVQRTAALLRPYAAKMEDALREAVRRLNPRTGRNADRLRKAATAELEKRAAAVMTAMERERERVNDQLDTVDNYRRTAARCGSW